MIVRLKELETLRILLKRNLVAAIVGARQVGKTTLAHGLASQTEDATSYFDLENPEEGTSK